MRSIKACMFGLVVGSAMNCGSVVHIDHSGDEPKVGLCNDMEPRNTYHIIGRSTFKLYEIHLNPDDLGAIIVSKEPLDFILDAAQRRQYGKELGELIQEIILAKDIGKNLLGVRMDLSQIILNVYSNLHHDFVLGMVESVLAREVDSRDLDILVTGGIKWLGQIVTARARGRWTQAAPLTDGIFEYTCNAQGNCQRSKLSQLLNGNLSIGGQLTNGNIVELKGDQMELVLMNGPDGVRFNFQSLLFGETYRANVRANCVAFASAIRDLSERDKARFAIECMRMPGIEVEFLTDLSRALGTEWSGEQGRNIIEGQMPSI